MQEGISPEPEPPKPDPEPDPEPKPEPELEPKSELEPQPEPELEVFGLGDIEELHVLLHICSFLAPNDLARLACVSRCFGAKIEWHAIFLLFLVYQAIKLHTLSSLKKDCANSFSRTGLFSP
eukprot:COSAG02_NODE_90_length_37755_cov_29.833364_23_plen_122_part_00